MRAAKQEEANRTPLRRLLSSLLVRRHHSETVLNPRSLPHHNTLPKRTRLLVPRLRPSPQHRPRASPAAAPVAYPPFQLRFQCLVPRLPPPVSVPTDRSAESPPAPASLAPKPPRKLAPSPWPSAPPSSEPAPPLHYVASTTEMRFQCLVPRLSVPQH